MSAYTVSQLAHNVGVSVHIVRDYLVRGLLRPVACTTGGYGVFDDAALQRLWPAPRAATACSTMRPCNGCA
ncbi:MerR family transcriptional regulator, partial [Salmonella enterica]|uniref:MerR family transcriptional regulator n=1 Tax=Salmonella enterica TaxID=28901 RepID=UPI001E5DA88D